MSTGILERVNSPADVKNLSYKELSTLAKEIRELIIHVVSKNGGHLSSNLGVVDLTIALHKVFSTPTDKIIWDVGHQCYTHKILTGRKDRMFTIRKQDGLVGFPDIFESEHDALNTGHASTSLAFASGMAVARDRQGEHFHIVPVIGDGALTGGVALEALNHIGQVKQPLIIILNDNKMSISPNVGAIPKYLNYLASGRPYIRLKEVLQKIFKAIPGIGKFLVSSSRRVLDIGRRMLVPGTLFNDLGVKYIGPINGHDLKEMVKEFEQAKKYDFPVLLHVVTKKGKGYEPATENPSTFHSSAPFDIQNGKFHKGGGKTSYSKVFGQTALRLVREDRSIVALTAAMPEGTGLNLVQEEFPGNFFDVGIAEQYMFIFAGGLSLGGMKPLVAIYSTFLQRSLDQVIHDIILMKIPLVAGIDRAGLIGGDGSTHQGIYDISMLNPLPGIVLMAPRDENELQHMVYTGFKLKKPVFIRYPKEPAVGVELDKEFKELPLGKSEILREGKDGLILAVGPLVNRALAAAEKLSQEDGLEMAVVNVRFIKPLDKELILRLTKENKNEFIVTIEDGVCSGGFSSSVRNLLISERIKDVKVLPLGVPDKIINVASREQLLARYHLDAVGIREEIKQFLNNHH